MVTNAVRSVLKLGLLFIALGLPSLPCLAQNQLKSPFPLLDLVPARAYQFNISADFGFPPSSVPLGLIPDVDPVPAFRHLATQPLLVSSTIILPNITRTVPRYSCPPAIQIDLLSTCLFAPSPKFAAAEDRLGIYPLPPIQPAHHPAEKFHWAAALEQSFGFLVVGHAFRLANDDGARTFSSTNLSGTTIGLRPPISTCRIGAMATVSS